MISLKEEQTIAMDNIQALLNNRDREVNIVEKIKDELGKLALIESKMGQNEFFMMQIAQSSMQKEESNDEKKEVIEFSSSGETNSKHPSEK